MNILKFLGFNRAIWQVSCKNGYKMKIRAQEEVRLEKPGGDCKSDFWFHC